MKAELVKKLEDSFNDKIKEKIALTNSVTLLSFSKKKVIIKRGNQKTKKVYEFLKAENVEEVNYPLKMITDNKEIFFVYNYVNNYEAPNNKKIINLLESLKALHEKTSFEVKLADINFKYFMRTYRKLDFIFQNLEMLIREAEVKSKKTDLEWILLSKYHIYLDTKIIMYDLQRKIHKYVDNHGVAIYALNHGNPSLEHYINGKFISFDNAYLGIVVSDYAKFFISIDHIDGQYFKYFDDYLNSLNNNFYKIYFKFFVLYLYMISLSFDSYHAKTSVSIYNQIASKISRFLNYSANYK